MHTHRSRPSLFLFAVGFVGAAWVGCMKPADDGKIPLTATSEAARKEYLLGRDLADRLLFQNSLEHFDKAIALDPGLAMAELDRSNSSATAKELLEHMKKAVSLAGSVSEGERLLILANEAGINGNAAKQKELLEKLVAAFPKDERAQNVYGNYFAGQQENEKAVEHLKRATELAPAFSSPYNTLGYTYRAMEKYPEAGQAFKKYIELIPNDPNPYDSYGELLLKEGKFEASMENYGKALERDPNFVSSRIGLAVNLMYMGKPREAESELQKLSATARNDGERRAALVAMEVLHLDGGAMDKALTMLDEQYALAEKSDDAVQMVADLDAKGTILVEMGRCDDAIALFDREAKMIEQSDFPPDARENVRLFLHFDLATAAMGKNDMKKARAEAEKFQKGALMNGNNFQVMASHQLAGMIALSAKDGDEAIAELGKANQQNPQNLYRIALAYQAKGDAGKAKEFCQKAAHFYSIPSSNYALVRMKAEKMLSGIIGGE